MSAPSSATTSSSAIASPYISSGGTGFAAGLALGAAAFLTATVVAGLVATTFLAATAGFVGTTAFFTPATATGFFTAAPVATTGFLGATLAATGAATFL